MATITKDMLEEKKQKKKKKKRKRISLKNEQQTNKPSVKHGADLLCVGVVWQMEELIPVKNTKFWQQM